MLTALSSPTLPWSEKPVLSLWYMLFLPAIPPSLLLSLPPSFIFSFFPFLSSPHFLSPPLPNRHIPNCSHWVQQDAPDLVNQYMREFLENWEAPTRRQLSSPLYCVCLHGCDGHHVTVYWYFPQIKCFYSGRVVPYWSFIIECLGLDAQTRSTHKYLTVRFQSSKLWMSCCFELSRGRESL